MKTKRFPPKGSSPILANRNLPAEDEVQEDKEEKEDCYKKMGQPQEMDIDVAHRYWHFRETLLTGKLEVFDGCTISKAKACAFKKKP